MKETSEKKPARLGPGQRRFIQKVIDVYQRVSNAEPVVAICLDPTAKPRSYKWSDQSCHYKVDIENCIRDVVRGQPELSAAWEQLVADCDNLRVFTETEIRLIRALVPALQARSLDPWTYFKPARRAA